MPRNPMEAKWVGRPGLKRMLAARQAGFKSCSQQGWLAYCKIKMIFHPLGSKVVGEKEPVTVIGGLNRIRNVEE